MMDDALDEALIVRGISARGDSCVDETPHVRQDPHVLSFLPQLGILNCPMEGR